MNVILFGFKGCGKTHFGRLLASRINKPFIDTDDLIMDLYAETGHRLPVREIYQILGEKKFRLLETDAIHRLADMTESVIALGGGAALNSEHVAFLQKLGQMVYLEASFETIQKRILKQGVPPFVEANNPIESLRKIYHERKPVYESIFACRINTDLFDEEGVIAALISIIYREEPPNGF
jgi:shikimate kinase